MAHAMLVSNTPSPVPVAAHRLVIESVLAGKAYCTCGGWFYTATAETTTDRIRAAFGAHGSRRTVYVVAWDSESSGGFDWYLDQVAATAAYEKEKTYVDSEPYKNEGWTAYHFGFITSATAGDEAITAEIDADLRYLCDEATQTYGPGARVREMQNWPGGESPAGDPHDLSIPQHRAA